MKFLNQKEQVIDLEITPYGKSLLSMGRFRPEYYAFYDDEILYDSQYAGITEHQNSASVRIKEVPQLQTQAYFYSAEKQVKEAAAFHRLTNIEKERVRAYGDEPSDISGKPYVQDDDVTIGTIPDKEFNKQPLGNSSLNSSYAPAWNINVIEGEISSSSETLGGLLLPIPQLNITPRIMDFTLSDAPKTSNFYEFDSSDELNINNPLKGKFFNVYEKSIIIEIDELNTDYEWENFDIEVFEVEEAKFCDAQPVGQSLDPNCTEVTKEFLKPLFFRKSVGEVKNGILLDSSEIQIENVPTTSRYASYFFDINIDSEIDEAVLCKKALNKADGLYSQRTIECEQKPKQEDISIADLYDPDLVIQCDEDEE